MDELEELLGNLGKDVGGTSIVTPALGDDDRVMSRIKERRISRRMASKGGAEVVSKNQTQPPATLQPTAGHRPTSGLEDLDSLMNELGAGSTIRPTPAATTSVAPASAVKPVTASPAVKPATSAAVKPVSTPLPTDAPKQLDEIDSLMAALSLTPQQPQPQPIRQAPAPQVAKAPPSDPLLGDIDALMASLGTSQPQAPTTYQAPKPQPVTVPSRISNPPVSVSATSQADPDLDALISSLNPDTSVATAPARSPQPYTQNKMDSPQNLSGAFRTQINNINAGPPAKGTCATCRRPIHAQMMQALGRSYHPDCFVCGNCGDPLGSSSFYQSGDGTPNCRKCHEALFCARCAHCDQAIQGSCITAIGKKWHVDCFICSQCLRPFGTNPFYEKEGNPFCESCFYGIFSNRCAGCDQPIKADCINACGKQWHPEHFVCTYCKRAFGVEPYFEHAGLPYCKLHYHQQQGSLCGCGCGRPVMGRVVQALGKQWLPEHFICAFCMNGMAGQTFTERDGKAYCSVCYGKLFN